VHSNAIILQQIKSSVRATDPDATLILYGSYARGNNREDSDMDILVLIDKDRVTFDDQKRIGYPLYDISMDNNIHISPKVFSRKAWETKYRITPFYKNVTREGIIL
jgi:predicted nucleotidyltransferase